MNRRRFLSLLGMAPVAAPLAVQATTASPRQVTRRFSRVPFPAVGPEHSFVIDGHLTREQIMLLEGRDAGSVLRRLVDQAGDETESMVSDGFSPIGAAIRHPALAREDLDVAGHLGSEPGTAVAFCSGDDEQNRSDDRFQGRILDGQLLQAVPAQSVVVTGHFGSPFVVRAA